ncbi:hypothetical protein IW140_000432 [Coemansia sp. RSA 1813]|nr:hypothetical protein LPJ74_000813 [Coemansia sp. RSA 1843]KAJ2217730.1 hypothetical protein EV179_000215 [Coemansia sp. RSA 487]KAJ2573033.1 hypothetical protein IW140_000432 [Coemansia sp. RSA 1813]
MASNKDSLVESLKEHSFCHLLHTHLDKQKENNGKPSEKHCSQRISEGNGVIYTKASDFVLPDEVSKQEISKPIAVRKMGNIDVTANDWVYSSGAPSAREITQLKKHAKQTAHALGTSPKKVIEDAQKG